MLTTHRPRPRRALVAGALLAAVVAVGVAPSTAHAAAPAQSVAGTEVASFIRTEWWPQARSSVPGSDVGYETLPLKKVRCPKSIAATDGDSQEVLAGALGDLAVQDVVPAVYPDAGVFTCVGLLDGQRLLIGGAIAESGDARFATASLLLSPTVVDQTVATEFATQVGGTADVTCSTRNVIVAQPGTPVRCKVVADDGTRGVARVVFAGDATIDSVDFTQR